ncbi:hypothetical protein [Paenibacillus sp. P46E]|uniref:hypothetical protein n=1 Tax=Paenibacillus sp. P46E TaxID=1349436 RepID=UPI00093D7FBF|nr:hypothetical protein [Paenibacillus sp. P46E]OKP94999.1 hypothetical protein A3849_28425 [Paenibacillus sp. P46E]
MQNNWSDLIEDYGCDVQGKLILSPFEYDITLKNRDTLFNNDLLLAEEDRKKLQYYDEILIGRAQDFVAYLSCIRDWSKGPEPIVHWWWHLDKIMKNELIVNIKEGFLMYLGEKISLY